MSAVSGQGERDAQASQRREAAAPADAARSSHGRRASGERRVIILGSTGSIGTQTIEVIEHLARMSDRTRGSDDDAGVPRLPLRVVGLAAGRNGSVLMEQARRLGVKDVAIADENGTGAAGVAANGALGMRIRRGADSAERLVREVESDLVVSAMVGVAGLPATLAAIERGADVALANKETLVAAGALVTPAARASGSRLLPVDSEHAGVWQCLRSAGCGGEGYTPPMRAPGCVSRIVLTASGGPFRTKPVEWMRCAPVEEALKHPTWSMGPKVTIDSASLMNKALEVIEAYWLFGVEGDRIGVLIHPQSIVHALVEMRDGSVVAQLGPPDMRCPIQAALTHPNRPEGASRKLDWSALRRLEFEEVDPDRFPSLSLAYEVIGRGGTAGAVMNAANEEAVNAYLSTMPGGATGTARDTGSGTVGIEFGRIAEVVRDTLNAVSVREVRGLEDVVEADAEARRFARRRIGLE